MTENNQLSVKPCFVLLRTIRYTEVTEPAGRAVPVPILINNIKTENINSDVKDHSENINSDVGNDQSENINIDVGNDQSENINSDVGNDQSENINSDVGNDQSENINSDVRNHQSETDEKLDCGDIDDAECIIDSEKSESDHSSDSDYMPYVKNIDSEKSESDHSSDSDYIPYVKKRKTETRKTRNKRSTTVDVSGKRKKAKHDQINDCVTEQFDHCYAKSICVDKERVLETEEHCYAKSNTESYLQTEEHCYAKSKCLDTAESHLRSNNTVKDGCYNGRKGQSNLETESCNTYTSKNINVENYSCFGNTHIENKDKKGNPENEGLNSTENEGLNSTENEGLNSMENEGLKVNYNILVKSSLLSTETHVIDNTGRKSNLESESCKALMSKKSSVENSTGIRIESLPLSKNVHVETSKEKGVENSKEERLQPPQRNAEKYFDDFMEWKYNMKCLLCGKIFDDRKKYSSHVVSEKHCVEFYTKKRGKGWLYCCPPCNYKTKSNNIEPFLNHLIQKEQHGDMGCVNVPKTNENENHNLSPRSDMLTKFVSGGWYCKVCKKLCRYWSKMRAVYHIMRHTKELRCPVCSKAFAAKWAYEKHLKTPCRGRKKSVMCTRCGKLFSSDEKVQRHERARHNIDSGNVEVKEYPCSVCERTFKTKYRQNEHEKLYHSDTMNAVCEECGLAFKTNGRLQIHIKNSHKKSNVQKPCKVCGKLCTDRYMYIHMMVHKERKYVCDICNKKFIHNHHLKNHLVIHTEGRQFKCHICSYAFNLKHHLDSHLKTKHDLIASKKST